MSTVTPLAQESAALNGFYVPRFEVKIAGASLPRDVLFDVSSVAYVDSIDDIDSFQLEINNWDTESRSFRYLGSETEEELKPGHPHYTRRTLFEPCGKDVEVHLGYGDRLVKMVRGTFTTMAPVFADGAATLTVTGLNALHQLRRKQYTTAWMDQKDSQIAKDLSDRTDGGKKRFPLPIVIDDHALQNEKPVPLVTQHNQYDIDFLLRRARVRGYVVFVQEADKAAGRKRQLYFGPSKPGTMPDPQPVEYRLTWGRSLMDFRPTIATAGQVKSVTVRGWHRGRKEPIVRTVTLDDKRITVNRDLHRMLNSCDPHEEMVVDEPVFTDCQARERAIAILSDQTKQIVTAHGVKVIGLPELRSGQVVLIDGIGARLSGEYFITRTRHTLDEGGYVTTFDCRREQYAGRRPQL
jgi:phage protein D